MLRSAGCLIALSLVVRPASLAGDPALTAAAKEAARGDCAAADRTLRPYLQDRGRTDADAYRLMGDCYARIGQIEQAAAILRAGMAVVPGSPLLQRSLGEALFRKNPKDTEAGELLRKASLALPADPEAGHYYAQWAHVNQRDEICVAKEKAALRAPGLNDLALLQMYTLLGMCQSRLEAVEEAKTAFLKARTVNLKRPQFDPVAAYQYVQLLTRHGEDRDALSIADEILQRVPSFAPALLERAKDFERAQRPDQAIEAARRALAGDANDAATERAAHGVLARCYFLTGNTAAAELEQQWIQQHPNPDTRR